MALVWCWRAPVRSSQHPCSFIDGFTSFLSLDCKMVYFVKDSMRWAVSRMKLSCCCKRRRFRLMRNFSKRRETCWGGKGAGKKLVRFEERFCFRVRGRMSSFSLLFEHPDATVLQSALRLSSLLSQITVPYSTIDKALCEWNQMFLWLATPVRSG